MRPGALVFLGGRVLDPRVSAATRGFVGNREGQGDEEGEGEGEELLARKAPASTSTLSAASEGEGESLHAERDQGVTGDDDRGVEDAEMLDSMACRAALAFWSAAPPRRFGLAGEGGGRLYSGAHLKSANSPTCAQPSKAPRQRRTPRTQASCKVTGRILNKCGKLGMSFTPSAAFVLARPRENGYTPTVFLSHLS